MIAYLVSIPVVALAVSGTVTLVLAVGGDNPLWRAEPLNLSEAAALRDRGEVARLLETGANPQLMQRVRRGFLYQRPTQLTAVDAAVLADRPEILRLLLDSGLSLDAATWPRAWSANSLTVKSWCRRRRSHGPVPWRRCPALFPKPTIRRRPSHFRRPSKRTGWWRSRNSRPSGSPYISTTR